MRRLDAALDREEALARALAGEERLVARVDVAGEQLGAVGVGAGDEEGGHAAARRRRGAPRSACG